MASYLQIHIPESCHENWNNMNETGQGRFCGSCQKNVIDFTAMSDEDLVSFFKNNTGNVCGRLTQQQLQADHRIPGKRIPWLKYFFQVAIPAFLFSAKTNAQGSVKLVEKHVVEKKKVRGQIPIIETAVKCDVKVFPEKISALDEEAGETKGVRIVLGGIASAVIIRRSFLFPLRKPVVDNRLSIFPNPVNTHSSLNIKWNKNVTANQSVEIFDLSGNLVQQEMLAIKQKTSMQAITLKPLAAGMYVIKVTDSRTRTVSSKQFTIQ
jgi:hypothetical protein